MNAACEAKQSVQTTLELDFPAEIAPRNWIRLARNATATACALASIGASGQRFGDWQVDRNRETIVAVTQNNSDSVLGYACSRSSNQCLFFYMPDKLKCNEGGRYVLLFNGGRESSSRSTTCKQLDWRDGYQYANVLDPSDALNRQMLNADGGTLGIARGTGADGFSTSKFSMRGFRDAFDRVNRRRDDRNDRGGPLGDFSTDRPAGGGGNSGSDVEMFEHENYQGRRLNGRGDVANLQDHQFNDVISSIIVNRGRWQFCTDAFYAGRCSIYGPGSYPGVGSDNDLYSSFRRVN